MKIFLAIVWMISVPNELKIQDHVELIELGPIVGVELEEDWSYRRFRANDDYLIWHESHRNWIYVYNLESNDLNIIELNEGRGPYELARFSDLYISSNDIIYVVDNGNAKYLRFEVSGESLDDLTPPSEIIPYRLAGNDKYEVVMEPISPDNIFWIRSKSPENYLSVETQNQVIDEFPTPFHRDGWFTVQDQYLIHMTRYYAHLFVFDLSEQQEIRKIEFDKSEIKESEPVQDSDGNPALLPPSQVDILNIAVQPVPKKDNHIFLLSEGEGEKRKYGLNKLFEIDYLRSEFVYEHQLDRKVDEIATNNDLLFAYSSETNTIYKYQVVYEK